MAAWEKASEINAQFLTALPISELRATVKSVTTWTWRKYEGTGSKTRRGVMRLETSDLDLQQKQILSGKFGASESERKTRGKIAAAVAVGGFSTAKELAEKAGVGRATLYRHIDLWRP